MMAAEHGAKQLFLVLLPPCFLPPAPLPPHDPSQGSVPEELRFTVSRPGDGDPRGGGVDRG